METVCHQHTDLRVQMPSLFSELSHANSEQVGDYQQIQQRGGARALPLCHSPGDSVRGSLYRNRAWSGGAINTVFNAT